MFYYPGDFSFVNKYQDIYEYDYKVISKMGEIAWNALRNWDIDNHVNGFINDQLYPGHTALTYRLSINNLIEISINGWDNFVKLSPPPHNKKHDYQKKYEKK